MNTPTRVARVDTWVGAGWEVGIEHGVTTLKLIRFGDDGLPQHVLKVPLDDSTKTELAQALTGGLVIARPIVPGSTG